MNDDMLDGLNSLVNMADKQKSSTGGSLAGGKPAQSQKPDNTCRSQQGLQGSTASPALQAAVEDPALSRQILDRLEGIKDAIDALRRGATGADPEKQEAVSPVPAERPKVPPRPAPTIQTQPSVPQGAAPIAACKALQGVWPYLILVSAALELAAFALGMGYGAIVASGKFPFWYRPGVAGVLIDWVAAPAGVLLLPVIAGLLALGGAELQREGREKAAKTVWAVAGGLAVIALLVPFIA
jgi:hypothetical protein